VRLSRVIVVGASLALAAVWLIPGPPVNENRPIVGFPDLSRAGLASGDDFRSIDAALVDRLGAKGDVVSGLAEAVVATGLSPSAEVFRGPSGEPFLSTDVTFACTSRAQIQGMDAWSRAVQSYFGVYGIDFLWAVAPDKSAVDREAIGPAADLLLACSDANRADLEAFAGSPDSPLIVGWDELQADPDRVYLYGDSHWNSHGGAVFAELLLDRLGEEGIAQPGVFDPGALVRTITYHPNGGLYFSMGAYRPEPTTLLATKREGVVTAHAVEVGVDGRLTERWVSSGPGLIPGRTLVLHDSFWFYNKDVVAPYFADLTSMPYSDIATPGALATIDGYDLVIIQQVQRYVPAFTAGIATEGTWITAGRPPEEPAVP
jgi:hypothetical protein